MPIRTIFVKRRSVCLMANHLIHPLPTKPDRRQQRLSCARVFAFRYKSCRSMCNQPAMKYICTRVCRDVDTFCLISIGKTHKPLQLCRQPIAGAGYRWLSLKLHPSNLLNRFAKVTISSKLVRPCCQIHRQTCFARNLASPKPSLWLRVLQTIVQLG